MEDLKKFAFLIVILVIALVDVAIYWNQHLYYKARDLKDFEKRIERLEKASTYYPLNDLVFQELGLAYYEQGEDFFGEEGGNKASYDQSIAHFKHSIRINPTSQISHFYLGRALLSKSLISQSTDNDFLSEHKKAALLVNHYASIYFEVGKLFLSRWAELSVEDKEFTLMMLREIWRKGDREKILSLLSVWEMNVGDYAVIREIIPEEGWAYHLYAKFLGEKTLDLDERHNFLAKAEFLKFQEARDTFNLGERDLYHFRLSYASDHFESCLRILEQIRFYQNFYDQALIKRRDFVTIQKSALLNLAKSLIGERKEWTAIDKHLRGYLNHEITMSEVNDLERYLMDRKEISKTLDESFNDIKRFVFQIFLYFKQDRYSDIVRVGPSVQSSLGIIPEKALPHYIEILQLVGDSHQKNGSYYMAKDFYQMALERDPRNLDTLLRIRNNLELLNDNAKLREINNEIENILAPKEIALRNPTISKGQNYFQKMLLDGREIQMEFHFDEGLEEKNPLISIFFNGRVVWEDYLNGSTLPVFLESKAGENNIRVVAVNQPVQLIKLRWKTS